MKGNKYVIRLYTDDNGHRVVQIGQNFASTQAGLWAVIKELFENRRLPVVEPEALPKETINEFIAHGGKVQPFTARGKKVDTRPKWTLEDLDINW